MTTPTAQQMLDKYLDAEQAILSGKELRWGDRLLRMEDLDMVQAGRREWEKKVAQQARVAAGAPRDNYSLASFGPADLTRGPR